MRLIVVADEIRQNSSHGVACARELCLRYLRSTHTLTRTHAQSDVNYSVIQDERAPKKRQLLIPIITIVRLVSGFIIFVSHQPTDMDLSSFQSSAQLGQQYLRKNIGTADDPIKAIEEFQLDRGILLPSLRPMLPLLDLHGVKRFEFHQSVLEELKTRLKEQTEKLGKSDNPADHRRLQELLVRSFSSIKEPTLQPVVMSVLKNVNNLDKKILKMLISDKNIYNACDLNVKRQIWIDFQSVFGDECSPLFQQYIQEKDRLLTDALDVDLPFYAITPKQRRQNEIIQKFADMVGDNRALYDIMLQFLRTLFVKTKNIHYCSLRVEFLMALHDKDVHEVTTLDPVHKFIWCLDACIREQAIDPKRSRELQAFLESIKPGQEHVLADISMVLCDPYAIHFLASSAFKIINHLITIGALPRGHTVLILILRCLNLGLHSWDIINSSVYREPRLDVKIFTKFLPMLMTIKVDDAISENSGSPPESFQKFIERDRLAAVLAKRLTQFRQ
jgi:negative elongation factor B